MLNIFVEAVILIHFWSLECILTE